MKALPKTLQGMMLAAGVFCLPLVINHLPSQAYAAAQKINPELEQQKKADSVFVTAKQKFLNELWIADPDTAMYAGKFTHADKLVIPDAAQRERYSKFLEVWTERLSQFDIKALSSKEATDLTLILNYLKANQWELNEFKDYTWNPSSYGVAGGFDAILNTEFAPKAVRIKLAIKRLAGVPAYYAAAKANITVPTLEHTYLAKGQTLGGLEVFDALEKAAKEVNLTAQEQSALTQGMQAARAAVNDFHAYLVKLESDFKNGNARSFRIGKAMYEAKFKANIQSEYTAEQTYQRAIAAKEQALQNMDQLADQLWTKVMGEAEKPSDRFQKIGAVIAKLSEQHVDAKNYIDEIRRQMPILEKWVKDRDLLSIDTKKPLIVRPTPAYSQGFSIASIEAPGIFRPNDKTYYNVAPLDNMDPQRAESHLREYNHWVLQILNIHEAIPGHYTQLQHANRSPSVVKTLFGNGAMIEGWAVYSERMMLESGYGDNAPEMWLMYYKWNLRTISNTILDYSVHVLGMSEAEAKDLLMRQAFQTQAEADGKWGRVRYSSVQLTSYFSGYSDILEFREQLKREQGAKFNLKKFHEQFLSYGSAPVGLIKKMMLDSKPGN